MKKLIGIMLVICMLFTVAAAANTITQNGDPLVADETRSITVYYKDLPSTAQATLFAYDVTSVENATALTPYDKDTTPIVGIDQSDAEGSFTFKVSENFIGKIVVKIGGTDVSDPIEMLVEFKAAGSGDEGGADEIEITLAYGDVNGDGVVNGKDASLVLQKVATIIPGFTDKQNRAIPDAVADVNADGVVNGKDASLVLQKVATIIPNFTDKSGNALTEYTYTYVAPEE